MRKCYNEGFFFLFGWGSRKTVWNSLHSDMEIRNWHPEIHCLTYDRVGTGDRPGKEGSFNPPTMGQLLFYAKQWNLIPASLSQDQLRKSTPGGSQSDPACPLNAVSVCPFTCRTKWQQRHFFKAQNLPTIKGEMDSTFPFAIGTSVHESTWTGCERPDHNVESHSGQS